MSLFDSLSSPIANTRFTWAKALWLPRWSVHVIPTKEQEENIINVALKLQKISNLLNKDLVILSWLRPSNYNDWKSPHGVAGAVNSSHTKGMAVDFSIPGMIADDVRVWLEPKLEEMKLRCENLPKSNWVHVDIRTPGPGGRFFRP